MKSYKTLQTLFKLGRILSKIAFVFSVIGFCACIAGMIGSGIDGFIKIGGVTLHGMIANEHGLDIRSVVAALSGWMIFCAGEAVLAKFAEIYFKNELLTGTPFTSAGAKEMLRLGILTLVIPTGCAVIGSIFEGIVAGILKVEKMASMGVFFDNSASIVLGVMFIFISLLCRYGAELVHGQEKEIH